MSHKLVQPTQPAKTKCPVCGNVTKEINLGRAGLTKTELEILRRHVKDGTCGKLIQLVDIVMGKLDPERMNRDLVTKNAVAEILRALGGQELAVKNGTEEVMKILNEIRLKIAGTAIGKIGEAITLRDFKAAMSSDEFSEEKADRHGTDIVASVKENKTSVGKIAISVKYDNQWKSEFVHQLQNNMRHEGTDFGILATNSLPKEALSNKVHVIETPSNGMILILKQDYASVAYQGLRQAVIAWEKSRKTIKDAQVRIEEKSGIFKAVVDWINGRRFKEMVEYITISKKLSEETDELASQIRDHTVRKVKNLLELQQQIRTNLGYTSEAVSELKKTLEGDEKQNHHSSS